MASLLLTLSNESSWIARAQSTSRRAVITDVVADEALSGLLSTLSTAFKRDNHRSTRPLADLFGGWSGSHIINGAHRQKSLAATMQSESSRQEEHAEMALEISSTAATKAI